MFKRLNELLVDTRETVSLKVDGQPVEARAGDTVAAAMLAAGIDRFRTTPVTEAPRAPYCMMGICFDCLAEIDGVPNRQSCMVEARPGMRIRRQIRAREIALGEP